MYGKKMTVDEVLDEVEKDASIYRSSGGGITLSGGECPAGNRTSARPCSRKPTSAGITRHRDRVHVPPGTTWPKCCHTWTPCSTTTKLTIPERHKKWTGAGTNGSWRTSRKPTKHSQHGIHRPHPADSRRERGREHIRAVLAFIRPHKNVIDYELLPYHRLRLGRV